MDWKPCGNTGDTSGEGFVVKKSKWWKKARMVQPVFQTYRQFFIGYTESLQADGLNRSNAVDAEAGQGACC